jgi:hypothetical protein
MSVVADLRKLKAMAKAGIIELHRDTGLQVRHWCGPLVRALYVKGRVDRKFIPWKWRGRTYELKYFAGCWSPFVIDVELAEQADVRNKELFA